MITILIAIFIVLNIIDTALTIYALKVGMHEKNPVIYFIIHHVGIQGFLFVKLSLIIVMVYFAQDFYVDSLIVLNIVYTMIVLNNALKLYICGKLNDNRN